MAIAMNYTYCVIIFLILKKTFLLYNGFPFSCYLEECFTCMSTLSFEVLGEGYFGRWDPSKQNQPSGFPASFGCQIRATCLLIGTGNRSSVLPACSLMAQAFILKDVGELVLLLFRNKRCLKLNGTEQSRKCKCIPSYFPIPNQEL